MLETRFFCYLALEDERYHDDKNQERIDIYLQSIESNEINNKNYSRKATFKLKNSNLNNNKNKNLEEVEFLEQQLDEYEEDGNLSDEENRNDNMMNCLNEFQRSLTGSYEKMNDYVEQLKSKASLISLDQGIIDAQERLNLIKRNEDFQAREKDLTFIKSIKLNYEDLDYLMNKYGITGDFEIANSTITINMRLKEQLNSNLAMPIRPLTNQKIAQATAAVPTTRPQLVKRTSCNLSLNNKNNSITFKENQELNNCENENEKQLASTTFSEFNELSNGGLNNSPIKTNQLNSFNTEDAQIKIKNENCLEDDLNENLPKRIRFN